MKELPRRPGLVAKGYIQGQRKKYFNPLMFLVITGGASVFLTHEFGSPLTPLHPLQKKTLQLFFGNERLFMLLMVPLLSFFSWISFFRSKYNFAENCILQSYLTGLLNIVSIILIPLNLVLPDPYGLTALFVMQIYMITACKQFFNANLFLTIVKSVVILPLSVLLFALSLIGYVYIRDAVV